MLRLQSLTGTNSPPSQNSCYAISFIGFLDADDIFRLIPTAKLTNSNALLWPMWAIIACPFPSQDQLSPFRRALSYAGSQVDI